MDDEPENALYEDKPRVKDYVTSMSRGLRA